MTPHKNGTYVFSILYSGTDGQFPTGLALDSAGNVFGVSAFGGQEGCGFQWWCQPWGSLFEITTSGTFIDLHDFSEILGEDGCQPIGSPMFTTAGTLYGLTWSGGYFHDDYESEDGGYGVVFSWTGGFLGAVQTFTGADCEGGPNSSCDTAAPVGIPNGGLPLAGLIRDTANNLYGTTASGGVGATYRGHNGYGTLVKNDVPIYEFCQQTNCTDGSNPVGQVVVDAAGNVYGVAPNGGAKGHGAVFMFTAAGTYNVIFNGGTAGVGNAVVIDKQGNLYGTTLAGGVNHTGSVYKLTKQASTVN